MQTRSTVLVSMLTAATLGALCLPRISPPGIPALTPSAHELQSRNESEKQRGQQVDRPQIAERSAAVRAEAQSKVCSSATTRNYANITRFYAN